MQLITPPRPHRRHAMADRRSRRIRSNRRRINRAVAGYTAGVFLAAAAMSLRSFTQTALLTAWYPRTARQRLLALPLLPVSALTSAAAAYRRATARPATPGSSRPVTLVVGNITVGGTGKTPLAARLAMTLAAQPNLRVGLVARGYGAEGDHANAAAKLVAAADAAGDIGDEALMLRRITDLPVAVCRARRRAVELLATHCRCNVVVADDGLQHYDMPRDLEIAVIDGERGFGNGWLLPAGPLREPVRRLRSVDYVVVNGDARRYARWRPIPMRVFAATLTALRDGRTQALDAWSGLTVHAVAGLGHPQRFFSELRAHGLHVIEHPFADHHRFRPGDLRLTPDHPILMTAKDAVKCHSFAPANAWTVNAQVELPPTFLHDLIRRVRRRVASPRPSIECPSPPTL